VEAQNRDVLLREMQLRVKNNFQIILASIAIQKRRYSAGDHIELWITLPVASMRYRCQLAPRHGGQVVKRADYMRALCLSIKQQVEILRLMWNRTNSSCRLIGPYPLV
jgi:two-component sensor histidine kinase